MLRTGIVICLALLLVFNVSAQPVPYMSSDGEMEPVHHHHHKKATGRNSFSETMFATGNRVFIFSPRTHAWAAYDESGIRVKTGRASGGRAFCRDIRRPCKTIVGTFAVLSKGGASCKSHIYPVRTHGGAPMPYCMRFSERGYAIHGAASVPSYNASHGCIRVSPADARWLSNNFMRIGTSVIVLSY